MTPLAAFFSYLPLFLLLLAIVLLILILGRLARQMESALLAGRLDDLEEGLEKITAGVREEVARNREESARTEREQRQELATAITTMGDAVSQRINDMAAMQKGQLDQFSGQLASFAQAQGERLEALRADSALHGKQLREEVVSTLNSIAETMTSTLKELAVAEKTQLESLAGTITALTQSSGEKMDGIRVESATSAKQLREEVIATLKGITESSGKVMGELALLQKAQLEGMSATITRLVESNEKKLEAVRITVEGKLHTLQADNSKQLDMMRQTVDEKLQGTLEKRLGEAFTLVSERLELVHKGLGEMQTLATGVGDLKKVLTNVKTRGTWGEVQLGALLEQALSPDQYAVNVAVKEGGERVEFAIKLPGSGTESAEIVWLPIDAKFPVEDYLRLIEAQEAGDQAGSEAAGRQLEARVKACAGDICRKYLHPPQTTDFGILFLPIEGLFAEVIRRTGLTEVIQREQRVIIAGPTTLWAILSSLQMGFRTLAIQQRSSEVWNLLAAVKTEWGKYGIVLDAVQKKLIQATETIDKVQVRSRAIGRKLKDVQELPVAEADSLLTLDFIDDGDEEE